MDKWTERQINRWANRQMDKWTDGPMNRWINGQMDNRQIGKQTYG